MYNKMAHAQQLYRTSYNQCLLKFSTLTLFTGTMMWLTLIIG